MQDVNEAGHMSGAGFIWQPAISQRAGLWPVARHVFMLILPLQNPPPLPPQRFKSLKREHGTVLILPC